MEDWVKELDRYFFQTLTMLTPGTTVKGKIVKILNEEAFIDIGFKGELSIPLEELKDEKGDLLFNEGDEVEFLITSKPGSNRGIELSYKKLREQRLRDFLKNCFEKKEPIKVVVKSMVKGGYEIIFEGLISGFLPFSHSYYQKKENPQDLIGKEIEVEIIQLEKSNFVVSRRVLLEKIYQQKKRELIEKIKQEGIIEGIVEARVKGGFIIKFEEVLKGFLPDRELSWSRVGNPETFLSPGDLVKVKVLEFDPVRENLKVSIKALLPDPWKEVRYKEGEVVKGKVTKVFDFGAFVELHPGIEGFIPKVEMGWNKNLKPEEILSEGNLVEGVILYVNPEEKRLTLSMRKLIPSPWEVFSQRTQVGDVVKGRIKSISKRGIRIELEEGIEGLVHISNVSWERVENLEEHFKTGEEILAKVINLDPERKIVELSLKHLEEDPWIEFSKKYKLGDIIEGSIERMVRGGIIVKVLAGIYGFMPLREFSQDFKSERTIPINKQHTLNLKVGEKIKGKITLLDPEAKRLHLSYLEYLKELEKQEIEEYKDRVSLGVKLGDLIRDKLTFK